MATTIPPPLAGVAERVTAAAMQEPRVTPPPPLAAAAPPARAAAAHLLPAGAALLARHGGSVLAVVWLVTRAAALSMTGPSSDCQHYFLDAGRWLHGEVPYRDFTVEYPPLALLLFTLPRLLTEDFGRYCHLFACLMLVADAAVVAMTWRLGAVLAGPAGPDPDAEAGDRRATVPVMTCGLYLLFTAVLGGLPLERYDLAVAAAGVGWLLAALGGGRPIWGDVALVAGIGLKMVPVLWVPLWLTWRWRQVAAAARAGELLRRVGSLGALTLGACLVVGPAALPHLGRFLHYHQERGLQVESLWATLLIGPLQSLGGAAVTTAFRFGATEVDHPLAGRLAVAAAAAVVVALAIIYVAAWWRGRAPATPAARAGQLVLAACAVLAAFIALNKVFSPQYLIWLAPLVPAAAAAAARVPGLTVAGLQAGFASVVFLTGLGWLAYYRELLRQEPLAVALCMSRNVLMLAVAGALTAAVAGWSGPAGALARWTRAARAALAHWTRPGRTALARPTRWAAWRWWVSRVGPPGWWTIAWVLAAVWIFFANLSETTANDIWIQMRAGKEIFESGRFPDRETYTLTVLGRPFIAHEWLSSLLFFVAIKFMGDGGLSFVASAVALAAGIMVWRSLPAVQRQRLWALPLWLACNYLISFRMLMRPHIFTILAQCGLLWGAESWRRRGGWRPLLAFLPMQLVWVNLHGGAFFGPAFVAMLAGVVAAMVLVPGLQRGAESRRMQWRDVGQLAAIALGMAAVCLVNPYGTTLLSWSVELLGNDYAKHRVWEWTSPFLRMPGRSGLSNRHYYWLWLYVAHAAALWLAIAVRARRLPLIDLAVATVITVLSVRANRFVPEMAIFSLPIIMRGAEAVAKGRLGPAATARAAWLELSLVGLLLATLSTYGYAHSAGEHRPRIGWGFGGDMPYQEVALMRKMGLSGRIFNEYSDGALIIHSLVPDIRPVLDSRIDLFPLEVVGEYDRAYRSADPQVADFRRYLERYRINLVMLMRGRASPQVLQSLAQDPQWELLSSIRQRLLYRRLPSASAAR